MDALKSIQSELYAPKNQYNSYGGFKYRSCEDILEALKPLLAKYNATVTISDDITMVADRIYVKATVTIKSGDETESVTAFAREPADKKGMDASQITGTASSYARKYALNGLFLIDDAKDPDTDEYNEEALKRQKSERQAPAKQEQRKAPAKYAKITEQQIADIYELLDITGSDMKQMLAACKVNAVEDMTEKAAARCIEIMKNKL